jgi:shikimate kinase
VIVLVGFMGAGKTTVGRLLAADLDLPFLDSDHVIEARTGRAIPEIFQADGEPAFRALEHEVIADLLRGPDVILALGGGAAELEETRKLLATVPVAFLRVSYNGALDRIGGDDTRPMLARPDLPAVYARRQAAYESVATAIVDVDGLLPEAIAEQVLTRLSYKAL